MRGNLTLRMPVIWAMFRIGPVTLESLEANYAKSDEQWPELVPKEVKVKALIDTGASVSILDSTFANQMQLRSNGYCTISGFDSSGAGIGQSKKYPNYEVGVSLMDEENGNAILTVESGQIVGHSISNARFGAIIGMDILKHCYFSLNGPDDYFELIPDEPFVKEISSVTREGC